MSQRFDCADPTQVILGLTQAEAALRRGELVVMPTDTVYGIAAEAFTKGTVAVRMPLHQLALDLLKRTGPLAVSSANLSGHPPATSCDEAMAQLGDSVAVYLDGGPCPGDVPSTIVDLTGTVPRLLRQGVIPADRLREVILLNDVQEAGPQDAAGDGTVPDDAGEPDVAGRGDAGEPGVAGRGDAGEPDVAVHGDAGEPGGVVSQDAGEPDGPGEDAPGGTTPGQEDAPDQGEHSRGPAAG